MNDIDITARTIYGEARGEGVQGMQAVANVIMNRVALAKDHPHFGLGTAASACLAHRQFSCWNQNDPNRLTITMVNSSMPFFADCLDLAKTAIDGHLDDITEGATHYANLAICTPPWLMGAVQTVKIGHHTFFKNVS